MHVNTEPWTLVFALFLGVIAVGRATRLAVHDHYPPAMAVRRWWFNQTVAKDDWRAGWALLLTNRDGEGGCPFCFAPYAAAVNLTWFLVSGADGGVDAGVWAAAWWAVNAWAAIAYLAAILVVFDEPAE